MAPICATKSDRKSYMNEIDGFSVLLTFPKPKANRSRKRRQFDDFALLQGVASLRPIHSYKTACTTTRICSMCFAREENAITRKWQNQKHCPSIPSIRRNMQALPPREEWPCCNGATKTDWKNLAGTQAKVQGLQKGTRQLKSRKPLRKTQGQASFLDRRVRNMENRRGPLNRRIRRYSILQQLNFGDTSSSKLCRTPRPTRWPWPIPKGTHTHTHIYIYITNCACTLWYRYETCYFFSFHWRRSSRCLRVMHTKRS